MTMIMNQRITNNRRRTVKLSCAKLTDLSNYASGIPVEKERKDNQFVDLEDVK